MNLVRAMFKDATDGVRVAQDLSGFGTFLEPDCAALIWQRCLPREVQFWLDSLDADTLPTGRVILPKGAIAETIAHLCDMSGLPKSDERAWFEADIAEMARVFSGLMRTGYLRLRLDKIETDACRKFHIDAITARLVCTYRGPGTQYGIAKHGTDPKQVFTVPTGAPMLLRGTQWPADPPPGLLHRSPPIEGTDQMRLVLVLDPVFDPDEAE